MDLDGCRELFSLYEAFIAHWDPNFEFVIFY